MTEPYLGDICEPGNPDSWICYICNFQFPDSLTLQNHQTQNHCQNTTSNVMCSDAVNTFAFEMNSETAQTQSFKCNTCKKEFKTLFELNEHKLKVRHDVNQPFKCDICKNAFSTKYILNRHLKKIHPDKTYPCKMCNNVFTSQASLEQHWTQHMGAEETLHKCQICPEKFAVKSKLNEHMRNHDLAQGLQTNISSRELKKKNHSHVNSTHSDKPCECIMCNDLGAGQKLWKCNTCQETFQRNNMLKEHIQKTRHGVGVAHAHPSQCYICSEIFISFEFLKKHLTTMHADQVYQCEICYDVFSREDNYQAHLLKHEVDQRKRHDVKQRLRCSICPEAFSNKFCLDRHLQSIHVVKTFPCGRAVNNTNNLGPHVNEAHPDQCECIMCNELGAGEKLWECKSCEEKFEQGNQLIEHMKIPGHRMVLVSRPSTCYICSTVFPSRELLKTHLITVHSDQTYQCRICYDIFSSQDKYQTHLLKHGTAQGKLYESNTCPTKPEKIIKLKEHCYTNQGVTQPHQGDQGKPYDCNICSATFPKLIKLKEHKYTTKHGVTEPHQCDSCDLRFRQKDDLIQHLKYTHNAKAYPCILCYDVCSSGDSYQKHTSQHTEAEREREPFECDIGQNGLAIR